MGTKKGKLDQHLCKCLLLSLTHVSEHHSCCFLHLPHFVERGPTLTWDPTEKKVLETWVPASSQVDNTLVKSREQGQQDGRHKGGETGGDQLLRGLGAMARSLDFFEMD